MFEQSGKITYVALQLGIRRYVAIIVMYNHDVIDVRMYIYVCTGVHVCDSRLSRWLPIAMTPLVLSSDK